MATTVEAPPWLVVGAEVVAYYIAGRRTSARSDTVAKVGKLHFWLSGDERRYSVRHMCPTADLNRSSLFASPTYVVAADSDKGRRVLALADRYRRLDNAEGAADAWRRSPGRETRLALMAALADLDGYDDVPP
jgi:hypothetical protein